MITYNGKEYRNLQEQVKKNKEDIELLTGNGNVKAGTATFAVSDWVNGTLTYSIPGLTTKSIVILSSTSGLFTANDITATVGTDYIQLTSTTTPAENITATYTVIPGQSTDAGQVIIFDYGNVDVNATFYQTTGSSTTGGMSQNAITTQLTNYNNRLVADEANITSLNSSVSQLSTKKADKDELPSIVQVSGTSQSAIMSQNAVSTQLASKVDKTTYDNNAIKTATITTAGETANVPLTCQRQNGLYLLVPASYTDYVNVANSHLIIDDMSSSSVIYFSYTTAPTANISFILYSFSASNFGVAMSAIDYKDTQTDTTVVVQTTGSSTTAVMSQNAVSELTDGLQTQITNNKLVADTADSALENEIDALEKVVSQNKADQLVVNSNVETTLETLEDDIATLDADKVDTTTYTAGLANIQNEIDALADEKANWGTSDETIPLAVDYIGDEKIPKLEITGNSTQDGTPTPTAPIDIKNTGDTLKLSSCGKNLISYPYSTTTTTKNGITFTDNGDGTITVNGTSTASTRFYICRNLPFSAGTYTLSGCPEIGATNICELQLYNKSNSIDKADVGSGVSLTFSTNDIIDINIRIATGQTLNNAIFKPQLETGTTATSYEPYSGNNYSVVLTDTAGTTHTMRKFDKVTKHSDGKWYFDSNSNLVSFDGTENWATSTSGVGKFYLTGMSKGNKLDGLSSRLTWKENALAYDNSIGITNTIVQLSMSTISTIENLKSQLAAWNTAGDSLTVLYQTTTTTSYELNAAAQDLLNSITLQVPNANFYSSNDVPAKGTMTIRIDCGRYTRHLVDDLETRLTTLILQA